VVNASRGKPENAEPAVFITMRSVTPDSTDSSPLPALTTAVRTSSPERTKAEGDPSSPSPGSMRRHGCSWSVIVACETWAKREKCRASAIPNSSIAPVRWSGARA
jgi:hypothetical protein